MYYMGCFHYLKKSLKNELIHSYAYINTIRETYIKKLIAFAGKGFQKAFLMSSGTESTEAALKLMRLYGQKKKKENLGLYVLKETGTEEPWVLK